MKFKPAAAWLPLVLLTLSGAARADLEPFSFGASESVKHDNNIYHTDTAELSDWYSITELQGGLDQTLGRERLTANAAVNYTNYHKLDQRDAVGYRGNVNLDWSTIGDLSGSLGGSSDRHTYVYGESDATTGTSSGRNLQTTNNAYARFSLGGLARWTIYGGVNAMNRNYSASADKGNDQRQWGGNVGTRYSTSPDLSFGVVGNYTHGDYPNYAGGAAFSSRSVSATTRLQATGNSAFSGQLGYTTEDSDLQDKRSFVSGNLSWTWTPPSHIKLQAGLSRSSSGGIGSGAVDTLNERSLNTSGNLDLTYALTAKVSLAADFAYIQRKYSGVVVSDTESINGTNHTTTFGLQAHYLPTRNSDVSCGGAREVRSSGSGTAFTQLIPNYADTTYQCSASITFN